MAWSIIPALLGFYTFYTVLFDRFLAQKKILSLFGAGILTATAYAIIGAAITQVMSWYRLAPSLFNDGWTSAYEITILLCLMTLLHGGMGLILRGFISWYDEIQNKVELQKKTLM
jgi:two-component system, LytTR family, sensor kinase